MELSQRDREEIARLISEGNTSGRCDSEHYRIAWSLTYEKWLDDEDIKAEGYADLSNEDQKQLLITRLSI